ncbi:hypothetical protein HYH03_003649 [Edaphochlamys debaryana]|uniref:Bulb-type lectin domain-containing protein n=1 Tax=Edaphochlamys debaryana TaxID=47281 RepID=A0A835Y8T8_9CHLO|nr:hypothetical protein HYH03_003649 [Edaphochlamys debaryana]|eukprot:KAG2498390.1 hypothetical protein HYH03_003649 [Edaphochlamys debaryana]
MEDGYSCKAHLLNAQGFPTWATYRVVWSPNGNFYLAIQADGNFLLARQQPPGPLWATGTFVNMSATTPSNFVVEINPAGHWSIYGETTEEPWGLRFNSSQLAGRGTHLSYPRNAGTANGHYTLVVNDTGAASLNNSIARAAIPQASQPGAAAVASAAASKTALASQPSASLSQAPKPNPSASALSAPACASAFTQAPVPTASLTSAPIASLAKPPSALSARPALTAPAKPYSAPPATLTTAIPRAALSRSCTSPHSTTPIASPTQPAFSTTSESCSSQAATPAVSPIAALTPPAEPGASAWPSPSTS